MYEIDTSSILAYIGTIFQLVGGALSLDPLAFQTAFNQVDVSGIFLWIVLIGGHVPHVRTKRGAIRQPREAGTICH